MVQPANKRLVTEATVAAHVATQITTPGTPTATALNATYVRFVDQNGNPLPAGSITTIHVNTTTGDIDDITFEEA